MLALRNTDCFLEVTWLDPRSGQIRLEMLPNAEARGNVKCVGWAGRVSNAMAALYVDEGQLWFQHAATRWSLSSSVHVELSCRPLLLGVFRRFAIREASRIALQRVYVSPTFRLLWRQPALATVMDRLDEESEDFLLYSASITRTAAARQNLIQLWEAGI